MDSESRILTVKCTDGLSNRLRVLLSGQAVAKATGREFAMRWTPGLACGCLFEHLFQNKWDVGANVFFDETRRIDMRITDLEAFPNVLDFTDPSLYIEHFSWLIQPARWQEHIPLQKCCEELMAELTPIPRLAEQVRAFQETFFRPKMIGVHIRRGDFLIRRPYMLKNAPVFMTQIDTWLEQESSAGILLCTDDGALEPYHRRVMSYGDTVTKFVKRYGDRLVTTKPASLDRGTPSAIQAALVDLWLLRATDYFVGTTGSSFSELAVLGRSIPFTTIAGKSRLHLFLARWLKRFGMHERVVQMGQAEFGNGRAKGSFVERQARRWLVNLARKI